VAPLTLDHDWLATALDQLEIGTLEDGTALGDAILASINRLRSSPKQSRTIVLMTDGRSNAGETTPGTAAAVARTLGIKIHTIGIGGQTPALFPVTNPLGGVIWREVRADLDVDVLQEIATTTGGTFFRASNGAAMQSVYREIDRLARRPIEERQHRSVQELFPFLVATALLLSMASLVLRSTWLRGLF
jgi:Ca-activated chloride channel family protein